MGCGHKQIQRNTIEAAEGDTVRLSDLPVKPTARGGHCQGGSHWWALWMLWPAFFLIKGAFALSAPILALLVQPLVLTIAPLPLVLVGVGLFLLLRGARRGRDI